MTHPSAIRVTRVGSCLIDGPKRRPLLISYRDIYSTTSQPDVVAFLWAERRADVEPYPPGSWEDPCLTSTTSASTSSPSSTPAEILSTTSDSGSEASPSASGLGQVVDPDQDPTPTSTPSSRRARK